ncbi:hypothetical protein [Spirochaeta africana]|uniref:Alcohol acetyltransferase n=1 Tax=Spirochaeta africana (strain ATCC 700263 / DSM 8902 / Z-7692) TaxID=889378 RepID=H9UG31_SPIAZ|nr:hypothetical protein [Spirochaeta africana]AFG36474.1 hypothetical protein Spiaf_0369 [Spirochaeta africana DSM 8902]
MKQPLEFRGFRHHSGRHQEGSVWMPLDNAAKIFPAIQGTRYSTLFRLAVVLDHPVRLPQLQAALQRVMRRYPYFQVELRRGFFWYYLERLEEAPQVMADGRSPCTRYNVHRPGAYLLRVRAWQHRLAVEFCHVLTDGSGGAMFLRSLVTEYFRQCGTDISDWLDIPNPDTVPQPGEFQDANQIIGIEEFPPPVTRGAAFHVSGQMVPRHEYLVYSGLVSVAELLQHSRKLGVTITEYLTAALFWAYQEYIDDQPPAQARRWKKRPLRILLPVNLRPFYPTNTRRNFFVFVDPEIDLRLGRYDFAELAQRIHAYMQIEVSRKNLNRHLSRNVGSERNWFIRLIPLYLKDLILKVVYRTSAERINSTSLSNLGRLQFPAEVEPHIRWAEFIPPPSPTYGISAGVVSHRETLCFSFGSLLQEAEIERRFFRLLRRQGIHVTLKSNKEAVCPTAPNVV